MAKFYVQSGNLKMVLQARDSRSAAIWAAHRKLGETMPFLGDTNDQPTFSGNECGLAETIKVSQQGFDRRDAKVFDTLEIVSEWSRLLVALDRLTQNICLTK
jgi:hypothetical protein